MFRVILVILEYVNEIFHGYWNSGLKFIYILFELKQTESFSSQGDLKKTQHISQFKCMDFVLSSVTSVAVLTGAGWEGGFFF